MDRWLEDFAKTAFQRSADTAHDLKTPLNIAVLNLELLRMRTRKLTGEEDDSKVEAYSNAVEAELRRLARIFDAYFVYSAPPVNDSPPRMIDVDPLFREEAAKAGFQLEGEIPAFVRAHEKRMRDLARMLFTGTRVVLGESGVSVRRTVENGRFRLVLKGPANAAEMELGKVFKFYYTDAAGDPELSLATARLIAETYGGELEGSEHGSNVELALTLPQGNDETNSHSR